MGAGRGKWGGVGRSRVGELGPGGGLDGSRGSVMSILASTPSPPVVRYLTLDFGLPPGEVGSAVQEQLKDWSLLCTTNLLLSRSLHSLGCYFTQSRHASSGQVGKS